MPHATREKHLLVTIDLNRERKKREERKNQVNFLYLNSALTKYLSVQLNPKTIEAWNTCKVFLSLSLSFFLSMSEKSRKIIKRVMKWTKGRKV